MAKGRNANGQGSYSLVTKNGITYHRYRISHNYKTKEFYGKTKQEAFQKMKEFEKNALAEEAEALTKLPFADYMARCNDLFCKRKRDLSPKTIAEREYHIGIVRNSKTGIGKLQVHNVNEKILMEFAEEQRAKGYSKKSLEKIMGFVRRCLTEAVEDGIFTKSPARNIANFTEDEVITKKAVKDSLSTSDMKKLVNEAKRVNTAQYKINGEVGTSVYGVNADVLIFILYTGLRIGEALGLKWKNVDFDKKCIHVKETLKLMPTSSGSKKNEFVCGTPKTKCSIRSVPLYPEALNILKKYHTEETNKETFVFTTENGNPINYHNVGRTLENMLVRAGCDRTDVTTHELRHTFGTFLINNHVDIYRVSKILGHSSIKVTESVYLHLLPESSMEAVSVFDNLFKDTDVEVTADVEAL